MAIPKATFSTNIGKSSMIVMENLSDWEKYLDSDIPVVL